MLTLWVYHEEGTSVPHIMYQKVLWWVLKYVCVVSGGIKLTIEIMSLNSLFHSSG